MRYRRDNDIILLIISIIVAIFLWLHCNEYIEVYSIPKHKYILEWEKIIRWIR